MKYYRIDDKKVNKVYRKYIKGSLKDYGWFVNFSYVFERILWICAIVGTAIVLQNMFFNSHDPLDLILILISAGAPFGMSIIFKGVYREWILKEYKFRNNEKLGIENNQLKYSYVGTFGASLIYQVETEQITKAEYCTKKDELTIYGKIEVRSSNQKNAVDYVEKLSCLNIYKTDIRSIINKLGIEIEEN